VRQSVWQVSANRDNFLATAWPVDKPWFMPELSTGLSGTERRVRASSLESLPNRAHVGAMSLLPLATISLLMHVWIAWRVAPELWAVPGLEPWGWLLVGLLAVSAVAIPLGFSQRRGGGKGSDLMTWVGMLSMGMFSSLLVLTLLRDAGLVVAWLVTLVWPDDMSHWLTPLHTWSALAVVALGLFATAWGLFNARRTAAVVDVEVPIAGLPPALHGFTVAQISDVHVGPTIKGAYLRAIVRKVNALGADMVAITGDLVDGRVADLAAHVAPLASLTSTHGTYFVTGNHEYYSGAHAWIRELERLGVHVLLNQHVVLRHASAAGAASMVVAGVADYGAHHFDPSHRSDPVAALAGSPADSPMRLLLAHQPRSAQAAEKAGFDLQLSGHTHGGQFWPWNHFVRMQQPFTAGLHKLRRLWVYTSRGTGYWGPPKRFFAPSEITRLRLVPAAA